MAIAPPPPKKKKKKPGPPSKFDSVDLAMVERLVRAGYNEGQMAEACGVVKSTWYLWKATRADFYWSLKEWRGLNVPYLMEWQCYNMREPMDRYLEAMKQYKLD